MLTLRHRPDRRTRRPAPTGREVFFDRDDLIVSNVEQASAGAGEVTDNILGVSEIADETGRYAGAVRRSADGLAGQAQTLSNQVSEFLACLRHGPLDRRQQDDPDYRGEERRDDHRARTGSRAA